MCYYYYIYICKFDTGDVNSSTASNSCVLRTHVHDYNLCYHVNTEEAINVEVLMEEVHWMWGIFQGFPVMLWTLIMIEWQWIHASLAA